MLCPFYLLTLYFTLSRTFSNFQAYQSYSRQVVVSQPSRQSSFPDRAGRTPSFLLWRTAGWSCNTLLSYYLNDLFLSICWHLSSLASISLCTFTCSSLVIDDELFMRWYSSRKTERYVLVFHSRFMANILNSAVVAELQSMPGNFRNIFIKLREILKVQCSSMIPNVLCKVWKGTVIRLIASRTFFGLFFSCRVFWRRIHFSDARSSSVSERPLDLKKKEQSTTLCVMIASTFSQGAYGGYLYTYALKSEVHFTPSHGAYLTSLFWVSEVSGLQTI